MYLSIYPFIYLSTRWQSESQMAERIHWWTTRWLECRTIHLSTCLSIHPSIDLSTYLPIYRSIYLSISISIYIYLYRYLSISIYLSIYIYIYLYIYLSIYLSIYLFIYLIIYLSIDLSNYLSIFICLHLYTYIYIYMYLCIFVHMYICIHVCMYISILIYLYIYIYICIYMYLCIVVHMYICIYVCMYIYIYVYYVYVNISIYPSIRPSIHLSVCLPVCLSACLSVCLTVSLKMQRFCETSSIFALDNIKKRNNSARLPEFSKLTTSKILPRKIHLCRSSSDETHACHRSLKCDKNPYVLLAFNKVHNPLRLPRNLSERPKVLRTPQFLTLLTWKCASRHNRVHFFDISTSKSGPNPSDFYTFDLEMCFAGFATQRRALFRHLNFQKWSEPVRFLHFWLGNVLRTTTACTFSTTQLRVLRTWGVFSFFTCKCASRPNGMHFFISHLARRFSQPTFRPSGATNHWKNTVFRDFPTFSRICIFFFLTLSLLWSSLF